MIHASTQRSSVLSRAIGLAAAIWLCAGIVYPGVEAIVALAFSPPYSYGHNYISDLGVPACGAVFAGRTICSPLHALMNANFALQGLGFVGAAFAVARTISTRTRYAFVAFAGLNGVGNMLIGLFPETAPGPVGGVNYHILGALLAILFGNATILISAWTFAELRLARVHRIASIVLPIVAALAFAMLLAPATAVPAGVWERLSVYTITVWELFSAICILARAQPR